MIELIDSTLSLSRIEAGMIELELELCDLAALLRESCQRQQEIAERHKISLTIADLPSSMRCDSKRLDQVFTNLLSNAVKYSPDSPRIDVKAGMIGGKVVVSVRDHGLGIPKDELPKLFGKFFRASTSTGIPGTGIGLHLVRHLVELHGGTATIDSVEGQGTTASVTLPIAAEDRPAAADLAAHAVSEPVTA
jgi:signal transduction histidine kinase